MKTYARVEGGKVVEIIEPEIYDAEDPEWIEGQTSRIGQEKPIEVRFHPTLVENMIDISEMDPRPAYGWLLDDEGLAPPPPYQPTSEEVQSANSAYRDICLAKATLAVAPLQYAQDFNMATPEEVQQLTAWKKYMIDVNRVDLTVISPSWPPAP